jgi:tRNA (guanosine-2'-O-)-methyltransferase
VQEQDALEAFLVKSKFMTPERTARITHVLNNRQPDLTVILENVHDPHNVSAVLRSCDAVGIQEVFVLNTFASPRKKWGYRSSSSANCWLTVHQFEDREACFKAVRQKYDHIYATHLGETSTSLYELDLTRRVAMVFGNEQKGISGEALALCDGNFVIPQVGMILSLNISVACAVSVYEAYRQRKEAGMYPGTTRLPQEQWNELATAWKLKPEVQIAE